MHMNTEYKIVFHDNRDKLALSKKIRPIALCSKQIKFKNIFFGKIMTSFWMFSYMLNCEKYNIPHIFQHNHQKAFVNTLLLVTLKYVHKKRKIPFFISNTSNSVSLRLKLAVLGQRWEVNSCLKHQNISLSLNGIDGSKASEKALLEVSAKIGETKR